MKIVVAGSDTRGSQEQCLKNGVWKLYSILNEKKLIEKWDDENPLIVDSGAHTWNKESITKVGMKGKTKLKPANEFIEFYYNFIMAHKHKKFVFVEFDTYGHLSKEVIDEYYYKIVKTEGMVAKFARVYHPILDGGSLDTLRKWMDEGQDYIFIANDSNHMLDEIFHLTQDKVMIHGLAMTKARLLMQYPFFSVDSTSPLSTVIFGRYSRSIMAFDERSDIIARKSIKCFDDDPDRLEKAIIETKESEDLFTELWKKKGVIWPELQF